MDTQLKNISFSYDETSILQQINCTFQAGRFHAILGPNGSGKTTLLDVISGFAEPTSGEVYLDQARMSAMNRRRISQMVALVSQDYAINFPFSVSEVVLMGRHPYIDRFSHPKQSDLDLAERALSLTGLGSFRNRKVTELSGGEKQRCVFARALCQDTPLLLLDEAFSNMDISHTIHLLGLLKNEVESHGKTVIAVLHDLNLAAAWADHLFFLKDGCIKEKGNTHDVFTSANIRSVFNIDVHVEFNPYVNAHQAYFRKS